MTDRSDDAGLPEEIDLEHPNAARIYDYLLGGTANWAIDRAFGDRIIEKLPLARTLARVNRDYLGRAVRYCARNGISQFLDLGSGVPTVGNVHEAAGEIDPGSRVVYVDSEPVAVAHSRMLLEAEGDPARHAAIHGDLRDVPGVWNAAVATGVLDPGRPIALLAVAVLHLLSPEDDPHDVLRRYRELLVPGSHLVLSHVSDDGVPDSELGRLRAIIEQLRAASVPACPRSHAEIGEFFGDFEIVEPGVVWLPEWRPDDERSTASARIAHEPALSCLYGGAGRKR